MCLVSLHCLSKLVKNMQFVKNQQRNDSKMNFKHEKAQKWSDQGLWWDRRIKSVIHQRDIAVTVEFIDLNFIVNFGFSFKL